jgi:hypothetical protein
MAAYSRTGTGRTRWRFKNHVPQEAAMSRRPPSTYLTAEELKQIAAIKLDESASVLPGPEQQSLQCPRTAMEISQKLRCYLTSKGPDLPQPER